MSLYFLAMVTKDSVLLLLAMASTDNSAARLGNSSTTTLTHAGSVRSPMTVPQLPPE
jgi:hypothetical protein